MLPQVLKFIVQLVLHIMLMKIGVFWGLLHTAITALDPCAVSLPDIFIIMYNYHCYPSCRSPEQIILSRPTYKHFILLTMFSFTRKFRKK